MSEFPLTPIIQKLLKRLEQRGLLQDLDLSDEEIADSIWLALQMGAVESPVEEKEPEIEPLIIVNNNIEPASIDSSPRETQVINIYPEESAPKLAEQTTEKKQPASGFPFQVPAAPVIQNALEMGRAIRLLKRKVPSATRVILDEEATVTRIIEQEIWVPVTKPEPERWLDLELVIEESRSAFIWQEMVDELQHLMENHGAFRSVRVWSLKAQFDTQQLALVRRRKKGKQDRREHSHKELIHPNRRGLILVVSDCVSVIWKNGTIHAWLKDWSEAQPTAIVQLFPERFWESTQLGLGQKFFATAIAPGVANPQLVLTDFPAWLPINWSETLVVPVVTLEPAILKLWARVVAGLGNARISTYLFDLEFIKKQALRQQEITNASQPKSTDEEQAPEAQAQKIVQRFLNTASLTAQRLAGMMAAAPVNLSVVNLIRKTLLKAAEPVHVAEVYMGGLLQVVEENAEGQARVYDFLPGVRKALNQAMALNETEAVLDAISAYIAERIDRPIRSFTALLALLPQYSQEDQQQVLPFAEVAVDVLRNLGGKYADFAEQVEKNLSHGRFQRLKDEEEQPLEPEHKICTFEIAFIEIIETQTFEFVVATLERKQIKEKEPRWIIKRQPQQGIGIVEDLGEGVTLELMEIPGGTFLMGSPADELERYDDESPQHEVIVSSFYMGRYPITQAQWRLVAQWEPVERELDPDPSHFKEPYEGQERWNRPVEQVSWDDAKEFCARLSQKTKRDYRLPTEAEWEYACRAGTSTPFHFGETITTDLANYNGNYVYGQGITGEYRNQTTPVGYFQVANAFGLYDMHGNVWEWCEDDWHPNYEDAPTDGSAWSSSDEDTTKVRRGGSWIDFPGDCRSAFRFYNNPVGRNNNFGFRVVRVAPRTP